MKHFLLAGVALASVAAPAAAQDQTAKPAGRDLTIEDVAKLSRVGAPVVSPDGRWLVWQQRETDLPNNRGRYDLWRLDLSTKGAVPEPLVAEATVNETGPQFGPGNIVYFQSDKGGADQIISIPVTGGAQTVQSVPAGGFSGFKLSPDGTRVLVWADRKPGAPTIEPAQVKKDANAGSARVYDKMFVRHWDTWSNGDRSQLFVLPLGKDNAASIPLSRTLDGDTPSKPFGGGEETAWSPDGKTVFFALREAGTTEPLSTNLDIFSVPSDGSAAPINLTADNDGTDNLPTVSPDGKWLAYFAMKHPGYEADRQVLMLRDLATGNVRALTEGWDRSVASIAWAPDGKKIYVTAQDTQEEPIFTVDVKTGKVTRLTQEGVVSAVIPTKKGVIFSMNSLLSPDDFYSLTGKTPVRLTSVNAAKLEGIAMPSVARFNFTGANGDTVWGYAVKPASLAEGKKAPVAFIVHGGPQGSMNNSWSYRWNPAVFAGAGYAVVTVDFHGSTGYGQGFTDAINKNWGGWPLEDLQKGLAAATTKFTWLDGDKACALGASYGGYMINWIAGQWPDRFKCLVQHDGVFDARAMAYETEELWFDEWEHGGKPYHEDPAEYEKWNPVNHVDKWKTPMLVITGEKDFRIPYTQGLASFTALQRKGIASRLVVFPDENHWVLKPKNSMQWYGEVIGWLNNHTGGRDGFVVTATGQ
ncbi:S9 family peptidase [Sphingomonas sp. G-3-2-10]|uniref:S9 family peptidase n=1 Tax=Sphingomonas sp. G-3-2-10 TaxID=2728838 RepID=UPI00146EBAA5|nr:S9 family peptidase [Sphingomonas sp. G-3-2-10]NML05150.1 S9 family peptidase [Sphingomonas sp. G-3-2-10]